MNPRGTSLGTRFRSTWIASWALQVCGAATTGISSLVINHLRAKNAATTTKDLFPKSNYYSEAADSVTTKVSADSAVVSIEKEGAALHYYGGTVRHKRGKALAIPINPIVAAIWPSERPENSMFVFKSKKGKAFLADKNSADLLYLLLPSATIQPDSSVLPPQADLHAAASSLSKSSPPAAPSAGNVKNVVDANGQHHDNLGRFGKGNGNGGAARQPKDKSSQDNFGNANEDHLIASPSDNIARGRAVVTHLLAKKSGSVDKAMYRKDTGWIGIDYGEPGNAKNGYAGGHGISHIVAKHEGAIDEVVDVLQSGVAYKHNQERRKVYIIKDRTAAVLSKNRDGRLLITDFQKLSDLQLKKYTSKGVYHAKGEN